VDQFKKLQLWTLTEYDRIIYMDSDLLPLVNTEELFYLDFERQSTTNPPFNYTYAAVPTIEWDKNGKPGILGVGGGTNGGFFVLKPDQAMFDRLWESATDPLMPWNEHHDMEQGLLAHFFLRTGHAPAHRLEWMWNAKDMPETYLDGAKTVHSR
jgi:alpha-N-acetylglucosamine transferase